jgi:predicted porin
MKKSLIALAVAAAVPALAQAQTNVTMFGIADAAVQYSKGAGNSTNLRLVNSGLNSSRWGVRGVEDIGGGLKAGFWLESAVATDDATAGGSNTNNQASGATANGGGLTFGRRATVSLMGGFGEIRLGRDYTPSFWNHTFYDAFGTNGVGSGLNVQAPTHVTTVRASNSVGYHIPGGLPVFGQLMVAFGENGGTAANKNDGRYAGLRVGGRFGPVELAGAFGTTKAGATNLTDANIGGKVTFGPATVMGLYDVSKTSNNGAQRKYFNLGTNIAVGAGTIRASVVKGDSKAATSLLKDSDAIQFAVGYVHDLSKRTAVYTTFSLLDNKGAFANRTNARAVTTGGGSATALEFGLKHSF